VGWAPILYIGGPTDLLVTGYWPDITVKYDIYLDMDRY
jgi:hypothetical protein